MSGRFGSTAGRWRGPRRGRRRPAGRGAGRLVGLALALALGGAAAPVRADGFWAHWGDGRAEVSTYRLTQPRYGEAREGRAVLIFVTEDFSERLRVKADPGKHPKQDLRSVLKLNFVRQFQTGVYDYSILSSSFVRTEGGTARDPWPLMKLSFSAQEWCGHVYQQWLPRGDRLEGVLHSYFDGEADERRALPLEPGGVIEDVLPILVRGLRGAYLGPGESREVAFLPSTMRARLRHRPQQWGRATVRRAQASSLIDTALGRLAAWTWTIDEAGERSSWVVEDAAPHRILAWSRSDGEAGQLVASRRIAYWELNHQKDLPELRGLGLVPRPPPRAEGPPDGTSTRRKK